MKSIDQIQEEILEEFSLLDGDLEKTLYYIIQQGRALPELSATYKNEQFLIKGCQSKVWLAASMHDNILVLNGDSDTAITKGLVRLLFRIFNEQSVEDIRDANLFFINSSKINRFVGTQRSNGLAAMIKHIKGLAWGIADDQVAN